MSLSLNDLLAHGIAPRILDAWRARGLDALLPLQEEAVVRHGILHGRNLLVCASTSSGKTFVAELAAATHLAAGRRVAYLAPTRALAEEKYHELQQTWAPLGYRVLVATRERPTADGPALRGQFDLLVAVYEKMKAWLVARPELLSGVGLVVADEVQMLGEAERGADLDLMLTKVVRAPYPLQRIALSAVLGDDAARLADWLGCEHMVHRARPLELREGVLDRSTGVFHYRAANTGEAGAEPLAEAVETDEDLGEWTPDEADFHRRAALELARRIAADLGEQVVLFVPTRHMSRDWARELAESLAPSEHADELLGEIDAYEDACSRDLLAETLRHGVGFHNADLSWDLRALIERRFNDETLRALVSTSTLAQGVNLGGRNVIQIPAMVATDPWTGRHTMEALSRSRFHNQGGRGARYRRGHDFGRSILIARNTADAERMTRDYLDGRLENLEPRLRTALFPPAVLDLVASRVARRRDEAVEFLAATFSGRTLWAAGSPEAARAVEVAVDDLAARKFLIVAADGALSATGLGEAAAATGLAIETVEVLARWLREGPGAPPDEPLEALLVAASTLDAREFPVRATGRPDAADRWVEPARERLGHPGDAMPPTVRAILYPAGGFPREALLDFKKALLLDAWIGPAETREIEAGAGMFSGAIANLAAHFAWILQGAVTLAESLALPSETRRALDALARRLVLGCGPEALGLEPLRVRGLCRSYVRALVREGFTAPEAIAGAPLDALEQLVPEPVASELQAEARRAAGAGRATPASAGCAENQPAAKRSAQEPPPRKPTRKSPEPPVAPPRRPPPPSDAPPAAPAGAPPAETDSPHIDADAELIVRRDAPETCIVWGNLQVNLDDTEIGLLALLARAPGRPVPFERIDENLFPDEAPRDRARLREELLEELVTLLRDAGAPPERVAALLGADAKAGAMVLVWPADRVRVVEGGAM